MQAHVRDQLSIIERVLARAGRLERPVPLTFLAWGLVLTVYQSMYIPMPWFVTHRTELWGAGGLLSLVALALTIAEAGLTRSGTRTNSDRRAMLTFTAMTSALWGLRCIWGLTGAVDVTAFNLMWSLAFAIALLVCDAARPRIPFIGGLILAGGVLAASMFPAAAASALTLGAIGGLILPGCVLLVARKR